MLLNQIQNTDYMTSLISGLFCASGGSWRKYERASALELFLMRGGGTGTPHLCTSPAWQGNWQLMVAPALAMSGL